MNWLRSSYRMIWLPRTWTISYLSSAFNSEHLSFNYPLPILNSCGGRILNCIFPPSPEGRVYNLWYSIIQFILNIAAKFKEKGCLYLTSVDLVVLSYWGWFSLLKSSEECLSILMKMHQFCTTINYVLIVHFTRIKNENLILRLVKGN